MNFEPRANHWLQQSLGLSCDKFEITPLPGATSSAVFRVRPENFATCFVLRVLNHPVWLQEEPNLAAHEAGALQEARKTGIVSPELSNFSNEDVGFGAPVVLMSFLEGQVQLRPSDFEPWLVALARQLALLHKHRAPDFAWKYRSWIEEQNLGVPCWTTRPRLWNQALEQARKPAPAFEPVFIHRDFHPVNVLWRKETVSGIVDWINACQGPAGVDVAHCRINLVMMFGPQAAQQFLDCYCRFDSGYQHNPYWDVDAVLNMALPKPSFYKPWAQFGLDRVSQEQLQTRIDDFLSEVIARP